LLPFLSLFSKVELESGLGSEPELLGASSMLGMRLLKPVPQLTMLGPMLLAMGPGQVTEPESKPGTRERGRGRGRERLLFLLARLHWGR
jgi:hypothetical protein